MKSKITLEKAEYLAYKSQIKTISEKEQKKLDEWYTSHDDTIFTYQDGEHTVEKRIWNNIKAKLTTHQPLQLWLKLAIAACLVIAVSVTFYIANQKTQLPIPVFTGKIKDVPPGGNSAILTLSNGQRVNLGKKNAQLLLQKDIQTNDFEKGTLSYQKEHRAGIGPKSLNTLEIPASGQYHLVLADGSNIWLNSKSSLRYPVNFDDSNERIVELDGEGYFEIAKDPKHPFIVKSGNQRVKVLGTHFNINTYNDEPNVATTLLEGAVVVTSQRASTLLVPNQQVTYDGKSMTVKNVDAQKFISWKDGYFEFQQTDLPTAMRQIARWYNLKIVYEGTLPTKRFTGKVYRDLKLSGALKILSYFEVKFTVSDNTIIINN